MPRIDDDMIRETLQTFDEREAEIRKIQESMSKQKGMGHLIARLDRELEQMRVRRPILREMLGESGAKGG